jgi:hypothetical protein
MKLLWEILLDDLDMTLIMGGFPIFILLHGRATTDEYGSTSVLHCRNQCERVGDRAPLLPLLAPQQIATDV